MPRRSILSAAERASLLLPPDTEDELIRHYAFGETDLSLIRQRRGDANRLGVAAQLCLLRLRKHLGPELRRQVAGCQQINVNAEQRFQIVLQTAQV